MTSTQSAVNRSAPRRSISRRRYWVYVLGMYSMCRAVVFAAIVLYPSPISVPKRIESFDAGWYSSIVKFGYPNFVRQARGSSLAFFPGYPLVVRALDTVAGTPTWVGLAVISLVAGAVATVLITLVVREVVPDLRGYDTGIWWQVFPLSYLLCIGYSEALFIAVAAYALLSILREKWVLGGVAAALSGVIRPTGMVFVVVGIAVAISKSRHGKLSLSPLLVSILSLIGPLSYFVYLQIHTGSFFAWETTERRGWNIHEDFGLAAIKFAGYSVLHPSAYPWLDVVTLSMGGAVLLLVLLVSMRLPISLVTYVVTILALATTSGQSTLSSFPRMAFTAFPLFIPLAKKLTTYPLAVRVAVGITGTIAGAVLGIIVVTTHFVTP